MGAQQSTPSVTDDSVTSSPPPAPTVGNGKTYHPITPLLPPIPASYLYLQPTTIQLYSNVLVNVSSPSAPARFTSGQIIGDNGDYKIRFFATNTVSNLAGRIFTPHTIAPLAFYPISTAVLVLTPENTYAPGVILSVPSVNTYQVLLDPVFTRDNNTTLTLSTVQSRIWDEDGQQCKESGESERGESDEHNATSTALLAQSDPPPPTLSHTCSPTHPHLFPTPPPPLYSHAFLFTHVLPSRPPRAFSCGCALPARHCHCPALQTVSRIVVRSPLWAVHLPTILHPVPPLHPPRSRPTRNPLHRPHPLLRDPFHPLLLRPRPPHVPRLPVRRRERRRTDL